ncbi:uncharacterized protein LOC127735761 isoform X1 [Mytilus californianus]|uniref:uncharacterized protein LOC127735761 isoform X1 n=1 Tax=Mytilus californianus TaxID=6549 RepID=UPI00224525A0|nr:uncharacterized protein LOC127735761 isoform X1 [Mytilus californianus]
MAGRKPEIPEGYLGPQEKWNELGLKSMTHPNPEIIARDNHLKIEIGSSMTHIKFTYQLIHCISEKEYSEYVFAQMKEGIIHVLVHMPETGYYKLQLYALPSADESKSLPNVFNYLIRCTTAAQTVHPFPKHYAQWKDGCFLHEPLVLHSNSNLTNINWRVNVPHANGVAVVVDEEWFHFENRGGPVWVAKFSLDKYRGSNSKVKLSANFQGDEESKFSTMLEFTI